MRQAPKRSEATRLPDQRTRVWRSGLRVMIVTESFLPQVNGVTNSVLRVLEHLREQGHEAFVVAPSGPTEHLGARVHVVRSAALPVYADFPIGLATRATLRRLMEDVRPDVVHLASPALMGARAARAAADLDIPVVAVYQTDLVGFADRYRVPGARALMEKVTRLVHLNVDRTLAPSTASITQLATLGIPDLWHWPRGVDGELFHPSRRDEAVRAELLGPEADLLVGYVGRLAAEKELPLLRRTCAVPGVQVVLVGDGPERERLERELPQARFLGIRHGEDLAAVVASLDVFAHTGRHETFCQAAQEALASGVPVVAPASGGPLDLVEDGVNGHLYAPGDAAALASYVDALGRDPLLRRRMGLAARKGIESRTWAAVNDQLLAHYRAVITPYALAAST